MSRAPIPEQDDPRPADGLPRARPRALVVFEGSFGDTEQLARAVAESLRPEFDTLLADLAAVSEQRCADYDLVITGAPGLSRGHRPGPRRQPSLSEWLRRQPPAVGRARCASFETRGVAAKPGVGSTSLEVIEALHGLGYDVLSRQTFYVAALTGPVLPGELERARAWARAIAERAAAAL